MAVHYTPPPSSGTGTDLWKFVSGTGPNAIELNTAQLVTGMEATYPLDTRFSKILSVFNGSTFAGNSFVSGAISFFNGIIEIGGSILSALGYSDATNNNIVFVDSNGFKTSIDNGGTFTNQALDSAIDSVKEVTNIATTESNKSYQIPSGINFYRRVGGVDVSGFGSLGDTFGVFNNGGGIQYVFIIDALTGEITTNQFTAGAPIGVVNGFLSVTQSGGGVVKIPCII